MTSRPVVAFSVRCEVRRRTYERHPQWPRRVFLRAPFPCDGGGFGDTSFQRMGGVIAGRIWSIQGGRSLGVRAGYTWVCMGLLWLSGTGANAQVIVPEPPAVPPRHLGSVPVPLPPNLGLFVSNRLAAIELGKALFWDIQAGSDGATACASCHFGAGADNRVRNTLSPRNGTFRGANAQLNSRRFPVPSSVAARWTSRGRQCGSVGHQ